VKTCRILLLAGGFALGLALTWTALAQGRAADDGARREALRERWRDMSPEERRAARERLRERDQNVSPEERATRREALRERWRDMSPEERQQLRRDFGKGGRAGEP
jgi:uncharacterized protein YbdZ (MbtH family)